MDRRSFFRLGAISGIAGLALSRMAQAGHGQDPAMAGSVYYTAEHPGRWEKKVSGHVPLIQAEHKSGKLEIKITTPHEMNGTEHFIVKHILLDKDMKVLGETLFDPAKDKTPVSQYVLDNHKGKVYAVSMCNKHDIWLNSATI